MPNETDKFPGNLPIMEDNLPVMSLWRFTGNLSVGKLPVNITISDIHRVPTKPEVRIAGMGG